MHDRERALVAVGVKIACFVTLALTMLAIIAGCASREMARRTDCRNRLKQIGVALKKYSQEFDDAYPWHVGASEPRNAWHDLGILFPSYNSDLSSFFCPSSSDDPFEPKCRSGIKKDHPLEPLNPASTREVISYSYCFDSRTVPGRPWTELAGGSVALLADKKAGAAATKRSNHKGQGRNIHYNSGGSLWRENWEDERGVDPDESDDEIGKLDAADYADWWSDPPFYGE